jgi:streptogramin lyase
MRWAKLAAGAVSLAVVLTGGVAEASTPGVVTTFDSGLSGRPTSIAPGPDGNLWFTDPDGIGKVTPSGAVTEYSTGITPGANPLGIAAGPDGNLWFTEYLGSRIGKITTSGTVTEYSTGITPASRPSSIAAGPDGNLWFTEEFSDRIGKITTSGTVTEYSTGITPGSRPSRIAAGPDGNLWFTESDAFNGNRIGRITTAGVVTEFSTGTGWAQLRSIAAGPDGNLWFTDIYNNRVGKITTSGTVTVYSTGITWRSLPEGIAAGPDGNVWFVYRTGGRFASIGRITPSGVVTQYPSGLGVRATLSGIAPGPDGNMWFTEYQHVFGAGDPDGRIGRITTGASVDRSRPVLNNVALVGGGRTAGRAARKAVIHPNRVRFRVSEPARVTVRVERRIGGRWRAVHSHALSHAAGHRIRALHRRVRPRALAKGTYRAHVSAVDLAGGNRSRTHSRPFVDLCTGRCVGGAR